MSLLSHPNILESHCSFTVDRCLWVVMPFMSAGSLHSIISTAFPDGLSEPCIAVVLKETLRALYIKAGNILMDSAGHVKLADFGVSASVYEPRTPYWMAPEVIHSHNGYSFKADIWSFGITALELAGDKKKKKLSKSFKDMVASCLNQDPGKRPSADKLLKQCSFFRNCKGPDFLVRNVLSGLPSVENRYKCQPKEDEDHNNNVKVRRISGWNFNLDGLKVEPVYPTELDRSTTSDDHSGGISSGSGSEMSWPAAASGIGEDGVDRGAMVGSLVVLRKSLDDQREKVVNLIGLLGGGEVGLLSKEEQLAEANERLQLELESEKQRSLELEMELGFLKLLVSGAYDDGAR
ncbi:unnamed protein product [Linum tenue]|uniref:Protein kinase domain-containing protein n=1 Tax=Linum tenue TaxID=586396 RepID=A0AAV0P1T4_9ROSI|nr:unnamed protein product [Linum tenue]